ncbi:hypothetical protein RHECNPAF_12210030 [Rhizobium etli CNPAF512]|nr:hypothetical protein RHECNPAF_12210030 [Rhizobium etli CNPAF512]
MRLSGIFPFTGSHHAADSRCRLDSRRLLALRNPTLPGRRRLTCRSWIIGHRGNALSDLEAACNLFGNTGRA